MEGAVVGNRRTGYLGLGSNVGDRAATLRAAAEALVAAGVTITGRASLYETAPQGEITAQADFLNTALRIETELEPLALLDLCKHIEQQLGREAGGPRHGPRPIDIDVLLLGEVEMSDARLTLPHPEIASRHFVLAPLLELDPGLRLPAGREAAGLLAAVAGQPVRRVGPF